MKKEISLNNELFCFRNNALVGTLCKTTADEFSFEYDSGYIKDAGASPLSLQLPLQKEPFPYSKCKSFFENLLPEGDVRSLIEKHSHISRDNTFDLLALLGGECAGSVSIISGTKPPSSNYAYAELKSSDISDIIKRNGIPPMIHFSDDLRLSLAGAQEKIPLLKNGKSFSLPLENSPSNVILKPGNQKFSETVFNELYCMKLAKLFNLPVCDVELFYFEQEAALVIERYDRLSDGVGQLTRIHQEDFCQAIGLSSYQKYQNEGGPGAADYFSVIDQICSNPVEEKLKFLRWTVFNYFIGNADAHAKNISILYQESGNALTPFYDLLSTAIYPSLSPKMAFSIGGEYRLDWIRKRHFQRFAEACKIKFSILEKILVEATEELPKFATELSSFFVQNFREVTVVKKIQKYINGQKERVWGE